MKHTKKVAALLLSAACAFSALTACGGMGNGGGKVKAEATENYHELQKSISIISIGGAV